MTTLAVWNDLAAVLVPLGIFGVGIAVVSAIAAGIAFAFGASGLGGVAVALWFSGLILSLSAGFVHAWTLPLVAALVLPATIGIGVLGSAIRSRRGVRLPEVVSTV